ncbi:MAG: magnesium transporter [Rhodospirillales bacterium]
MTEQTAAAPAAPKTLSETPPEPPAEAGASALTPETAEAILNALAWGDAPGVREIASRLHYTDVADLLERISVGERERLLDAMRGAFNPAILSELDETVLEEVVTFLGHDFAAKAVAELDSDDALLVVDELEEEARRKVLAAMPLNDRSLIEEGLSYPERSAGRLMQREVMTVPLDWTVGRTIDFLRSSADSETSGASAEGAPVLPELFYDIFVLDEKGAPAGVLPLSRLLRARRPIAVKDIMGTKFQTIPADMDQEDVAHLFSNRDLVTAPVVNAEGRLAGAIMVDDVVDVIHEEHEEDIMRMGGVREGDLYAAVIGTVKSRFGWLLINLGTAVLASMVIGLFEATLERVVALAVLMPIVASMGGNAGTQTLTVAVRAIAAKELTSINARRVITKELMVGLANGVLFAVITGFVAWVWFSAPEIGVVIGAAMIVNMIVAALAGAAIPIAFERMGFDPAISSGVFLTSVTDVVGFFVFLGLAAVFVL